MKAFIAGGGGFVGKNLTNELIDAGYDVTIVGRSAVANLADTARINCISADTTQPGPWQEEVLSADVIINLTGQSIFHLWTKKYKKSIYDSRILTTRNIVDAMSKDRAVTFLSTSAVGFYGERGDDILTEAEPNGSDFLAEVCRDWEAEALKAEDKGVRTIIMRFGVVFGDNGGALGIMLLPYRFLMGGPMGSGNQWFSWIHIDDLNAAFMYAIENKKAQGIFNLCAPIPIRNVDMAQLMGSVLKRPSFMKVPGFALKIVLGEYGATLLNSQRALPDNFQKLGFQFKYPNFKQAIEAILMGRQSSFQA